MFSFCPTCQVSKKVDEDRAVIVFFRDVPQVKEFMESSYYSNMSNKILGCIVFDLQSFGVYSMCGIPFEECAASKSS